MEIKINASRTIDILIEALDDLGNYNPKAVSDAKKTNDMEHIRWLQKHSDRGQHVFWSFRDVLGCSYESLEAAARAAQKWYMRGKWEKSLPEAAAQSLLNAAISGRLA